MRVRKPIKLIAYLVVYGGFALLFCCGALTALINSPSMRTIPDDPNEAWQAIIQERQSREADLANYFSQPTDEPKGNFEAIERYAEFHSRQKQIEQDIEVLVNRTIARHGEPPPEIKAQLESETEMSIDLGTMPSASPNGRPLKLRLGRMRKPDPAQLEAEREAREQAELEARRQQELARSQPVSPSMPQYVPPPVLDPQAEQRAREQLVRDQQAERERDQREREQQLREQERQRAQAAANPQGPPNGSSANQPPPGFPATDLSQVKPRDIVLVRADDQWVEALVQLKRGKLIQVRAFNGNVAMVTIDRIRLKVEQAASAENTLPPALRAAGNSVPGKKTDEEDDDSLFVAKPGEAGAENPLPPPPAGTGQKPAARAAEYRTWTDDTGTFQVEAELLSFEFDLVQLRRRSDGKVLSLRIEKLSAADQQIVRERFP